MLHGDTEPFGRIMSHFPVFAAALGNGQPNKQEAMEQTEAATESLKRGIGERWKRVLTSRRQCDKTLVLKKEHRAAAVKTDQLEVKTVPNALGLRKHTFPHKNCLPSRQDAERKSESAWPDRHAGETWRLLHMAQVLHTYVNTIRNVHGYRCKTCTWFSLSKFQPNAVLLVADGWTSSTRPWVGCPCPSEWHCTHSHLDGTNWTPWVINKTKLKEKEHMRLGGDRGH